MKNSILGIIGLGAVAVIGWYGVGAARNFFSSVPVLIAMQEQMSEIQSAKFLGRITISGEMTSDFFSTSSLSSGIIVQDQNLKDTPLATSIIAEFGGAFQKTDAHLYETHSDIAIAYAANEQKGKIGLSVKSKGLISYMRLSELDVPVYRNNPQLEQLLGVVAGLAKDRWIMYELPLDQAEYTSQIRELKQEIETLMKHEDTRVTFNMLGDEILQKVETSHIQLIQNTTEASDSARVQKFSDFTIDVWIGKQDNLLYKLQISGPIDVNGFTGALDFTMEFYAHNIPNVIEQPFDAVSIDEFIVTVMGNKLSAGAENVLHFTQPETDPFVQSQF